jgi:heme-degrading monooxygenase HmoA
MFVLNVELAVKPGAEQGLEASYRGVFRPAISKQEGFQGVELLRPNENVANYRLSIAFDTQAFQQKWVATDLHQQVWPEIENQCSEYSVNYYTAV